MKFFIILIFSQILIQAQSILPLADDEYDKYTSVGNLGLTITNFGILGKLMHSRLHHSKPEEKILHNEMKK